MLGQMDHRGIQNGVAMRANHERDFKSANGLNVAMAKPEPASNKVSKPAGSIALVNGDAEAQKQAQAVSGASDQAKMNNLLPEITRITTNFFPLPYILQRLAQKSHNDLQTEIEELAHMPMGPGAVNGNAAGSGEDSSEANQNKKAHLLNFVQDMHGKWVKALVMSEWSKKSGKVSQLIDLHAHMLGQMQQYHGILDRMGHIKRNLYAARLPDPDIKTALQILATGQAPWMPQFNYIEPPPLNTAEVMKWIDELNVLLSVRLNLEDHDKIPHQFKNYSISSGRVTFKVKAEFDVDLTIGDDDFDKQFWFIDFRFAFSPAPQELTERLRAYLDQKVNEVLATDGLKGCYEFLHEYVLTHKINELRRQAIKLSRNRWIEHVQIERLNRALSIQYWTKRLPASGPHPAGPKSWVIIGVNSDKAAASNALVGAHPTSHLKSRWYRDGKEVTDVDLSFDNEDISAETLLKQIIGKHVEHILSSIYKRLKSRPRYAKRQASLLLNINKHEPSESSLVVQLTYLQTLTVRINITTGLFILEPTRSLVNRRETALNNRCRDPIEDGLTQIECIRCESEFDELIRRGKGLGWHMFKRPVHADEARRLHPSRDPHQALWLKREGWSGPWYLVVCLSLTGDIWFLVEVVDEKASAAKASAAPIPPNRPPRSQPGARNSLIQEATGRIKSYQPIPITSVNPQFSVAFFTDLASVTTDAMSQITDITTFRSRKLPYTMRPAQNPYISSRLKMPALYVRTSSILPLPLQTGAHGLRRPKEPWAGDFVRIMFRGVRDPAGPPAGIHRRLEATREVTVTVRDKSMFSLIKKGYVDYDVYYHPQSGQFKMSLRHTVDETIMETLVTRLKAIDRLVEFVASINGRTAGVKCESVTLRKFIFTYNAIGSNPSATEGRWRVTLDLAKNEEVNISLEPHNPHKRVWDMLKKLVNSPIGLEQLPRWLQFTLPAYHALDMIEDAWRADSTSGSFVEVNIRAIEWVSLHFLLASPPNKAPRTLRLCIQAKDRKGHLWWHVERYPRDGVQDEFDTILQPIFGSGASHEGWEGLQTSAVASANGCGIETMLLKISDAVKAAVKGGPAAPAPMSVSVGSSQGAAIVLD